MTSHGFRRALAVAFVALTAPAALAAQVITDAVARPPASQGVDDAYTAQIRQFTTEPFFLTPLVDHVPASSTVPTPLAHHGYIAGAADVLTYPEQVAAYMRAVAAASPRVRVETIGTSEEGREIIAVIVTDEATLQDLDGYKQRLRQLADPRRTDEAAAERIIAQAKPVYYLTGAIHSPETGSPEMLMELVYRLAVSEAPMVRQIRDNVITVITPVVEVDGRAKQVDLHMAPRKNPDADVANRLLYWGRYVSHDNNRDGMGLQLALTNAVLGTFLDWNATVLHDLHESASYLYTSTGRGPYNPWLDPIVVNEWNRLAYKEVTDLTALGVPGIYTYDFYDGWAPNYMFWIANMRNSIGRFYETQAARSAANYLLTTNVERQWHRPNTPLREVVWSIRNNVNLQQSGVLIALHEVASNGDEYLRNFYRKSARAIAKATAEGPAAYIFPAADPRPGQQARLLSLMQRHGIEVHRAERAFRVGTDEYAAGSYIVRMDQPYSRTADMLLDISHYNPDDPRPYDDVGWTHGPLFNVQTVRVEDASVLSAPMRLVNGHVRAAGGLAGNANASTFVINYNADNNLTAFRFAHPELRIRAARSGFDAAGRSFNAGSFIVDGSENGGSISEVLDRAGREYGFTAYGVGAAPGVATHNVAVPRIAVMHTFLTTQTEGWMRLGLDEYGIPYDYISVHDVRDEPRLRDRYDVIVFGPSSPDALSIVRGLQGDRPIPWMKTDITPNLGSETSTADMRGGLELQGVLNLSEFVRQGGTFIAVNNSASLPTHFGLAPGVSIRSTNELWARGGVFRSVVADAESPLVYGYGDELGVYFNTAPLFQVGGGGGGFGGFGGGGATSRADAEPGSTLGRATGRGSIGETDIPQGRPRDMGEALARQFRQEQRDGGDTGGFGAGTAAPTDAVRVIMRYSPEVDDLLISGGLRGGSEMAGTPALVDVKNGDGHVVLFSFNPFWRGGTLGSYALLFNALMHHGNLDAGGAAGATTTAVNEGS